MLLLCSSLGQAEARALSYAQFRTLAQRVRLHGAGGADPNRALTAQDVRGLGYDEADGAHIVGLLEREDRLRAYLAAGETLGIFPLTRISRGYPLRLREQLGDRCSPVLWYRGDLRLLTLPCVSVVGSRQPNAQTVRFARRCGTLAAQEGFVLCTGGAEGVDEEAEAACLQSGGRVIVFPAGRLRDCRMDARVLYLAEGAYDAPFSAQRALARNRLIHALGEKTYAAQARLRSGGTWRGCTENLHASLSPLYLYDDGSEAAKALLAMGAIGTGLPETLRTAPVGQLRMDT